MSKLGTVFGQEIARVARREARNENSAMRKASTQHRKDIAALKREVSNLKRIVGTLKRQVPTKGMVSPVAVGDTKLRFVRKGLVAHRKRLGLSAAEYGQLAGVSGQSVYNWETGHSVPHAKLLPVIAAIRRMGKREVASRLAAMEGKPPSVAEEGKVRKAPAKRARKAAGKKPRKAAAKKAGKRAKRGAKKSAKRVGGKRTAKAGTA